MKKATQQVHAELQQAVEQFLYYQAEILDERRWEEWLKLFTDDGIYWMPASPEQTQGEGVPNIFYEDLFLMEMRAKRLAHPRAHSQRPPSRTSHVVSNVVIEHVDGTSGDVSVRSKFYACEYRNDELRHFAGKYHHQLKKKGEGYQIQLQRTDLVNVEGPFEYVLQVWL